MSWFRHKPPKYPPYNHDPVPKNSQPKEPITENKQKTPKK